MKLFMRTFGCQMNVHDSVRIAEIMGENGYELVDDANKADVVVVNTCSVREKAEHKAISETGRMCAMKKQGRDVVVVVAGCVAQQQGEAWFDKIPDLDLVLGPDNYRELPEYVDRIRKHGRPFSLTEFDKGAPSEFLAVDGSVEHRGPTAFVTVMKGCNERCAYCIVPSVRGPERSRPAQDIIREVEVLVSSGVKEVMLLGQKVNAYREGKLTFAGLLAKLDSIDGLERIRFTSPHPRHMDNDLIEAFGSLPTLCEAIHLPVQSGSDSTLKKMGRRYTADFYRNVAYSLKKSCPGIHISTDLIVGYPGETEDDFNQTVSLLEDVRFSGVFSFKYSPRPGTRAAALDDDVPPAEKQRRLEVIHSVIERIELEIRGELVGQTHTVLVEGPAKKAGQFVGRLRNNQIINFPPRTNATLRGVRGQLLEVEVVRALPHCLEGRLVQGG